MDEYVRYKGEQVKIGTCEDLYYTTYHKYVDALHKGFLSGLPGNDIPANYALPDSGYRFRFPFPDEDHIRIGYHEDFDRGITIKLSSKMYGRHNGLSGDEKKIYEMVIKQQKLVTRECDGKPILALVWYDKDKQDLRRVEDDVYIKDIAREIVRNHIANEPVNEQRIFYRKLAARILKGYNARIDQDIKAEQKNSPEKNSSIDDGAKIDNWRTPSLMARPVMVHPDLTTDPCNRRGQVGMAGSVLHEGNNIRSIYVKFGQALGIYQADALLTLLPLSAIGQRLKSSASTLSANQLVKITNLRGLIRMGACYEAMLMARDDEFIRSFCTTTVSDWVQLLQDATKHKRGKGLKK